MKLTKKVNNEESEKYWKYVEEISREVENTYPDWKKGGESSNPQRTTVNNKKMIHDELSSRPAYRLK